MTMKKKTAGKKDEGGSAMDWTNLAIYGVIAVVVLSVIWKLAKKLFKFALALAILAAIYAIYTGMI